MSDNDKAQAKWYFKPVAVIAAILAVGPLALPLVWMSPCFKKWVKAAITAAVILLTIWLFRASVDLYEKLSSQIQDLQKVLK